VIKSAYEPSDVHVVHPEFRLRNDRKYIVAAQVREEEGLSGLLRLGPVEGAVVSMFDGSRTYHDVVDICTAFLPDASSQRWEGAEALVRHVISHHSEPRGQTTKPLLVRKSDLTAEERTCVRQYRPADFIVPFGNCRLDDPKLAFPISLLWLVTNTCQVKCQYCYMDRSPVAKEDLLPWERAKELLYEAHRGGTMEIRISGGDPLCYPYLFEFLDTLQELDFAPVSIPTKSYVSREMASRLAQYRIFRGIQFSIDSTVPEIADFIVQSPGFYHRTMESIQNVFAAGITNVNTKSVITPYTLPTIPKLYRDLRGLGVKPVILATYCRSGYWHEDKLYNHPNDYQWLDAELGKLKEEFPDDEIYYQNGPPGLKPQTEEECRTRWQSRSRCTAGREHIAICANGKVVACEQMPEREKDYLGDLRFQSIREVWEGEALDKYLLHPSRDQFAGTACLTCEEFDECQTTYGPCVRESCIHFGTRWAPVPGCPKARATRTM